MACERKSILVSLDSHVPFPLNLLPHLHPERTRNELEDRDEEVKNPVCVINGQIVLVYCGFLSLGQEQAAKRESF